MRWSADAQLVGGGRLVGRLVASGPASAHMTVRASIRSRRTVGVRPRRSPRTWLSIRVELVEGRGEHYWPRPGRLLAADKNHTFAQLALAIDDAFARWDRSHLHEFQLSDGTRLGAPDPELDNEGIVDERGAKLLRLTPDDKFIYIFDLGDDWTHLCTVGHSGLDPVETLGILPEAPTPYFGWGAIPDQYGRAWDGDDGESQPPPDPEFRDLPPLRPWWGLGSAEWLRRRPGN